MQTTLHKYGHVNTGWATRLQSERFFDPQEMLCPNWNNVDSAGRISNVDSFYTKTPGCNSATDRTNVENMNRPMNFDNAQLSNIGILGDSHCHQQIVEVPLAKWNGLVADNRAFYSQAMRDRQWLDLAYKVRENKRMSGCLW